METKYGVFVSMKDKIILAAIESLRQDGLKFSVDTLTDRLKISKKTVYKFFPGKEALAVAMYERYFSDLYQEVRALSKGTASDKKKLLYLYFDSKTMTRADIFNKYQLNASVSAFTAEQNDRLWETVASFLTKDESEKNKKALRMIIDGAFEKLSNERLSPDDVIGQLTEWL